MNNFDLSLYLVTDQSISNNDYFIDDIIMAAVEGGVTMVQIREKDISTYLFYQLACRVKKRLQSKVPLIINDRLDITLAADADGLHIGQNDIPYSVARKILGHNKIIGLSVENINQAINANTLDVDYIGISPVFGTTTKTDTAIPLGLEGVKKISEITKHKTVGIGGINKTNVADIISAGANGVAVVSAIMAAKDSKRAASELYEIIKKTKYELE